LINKDYITKYKLNDLTPVEEHDSILFKRDDLYIPFSDIPLSGGKVRQAISLIANNFNYIKDECDGNIYSATGVKSPQGIVVTRVAKEFGFSSTVFIGNSGPKGIRKNNLMMNILTNGGKIDYNARQAYEAPLQAEIRKHAERGEKFFTVKFGINLDTDPESIIDSVAYQVQNIPKNLDYLIVPCGSAIMFGGILKGCQRYDIVPKHIVGIQIAGYDRTKTIEHIVGEGHLPYEFLRSKDYEYGKLLKINIGNFTLDPIYEAKAYDYMKRHMHEELNNKKVLFWIVGNSWEVRNKIYMNQSIN